MKGVNRSNDQPLSLTQLCIRALNNCYSKAKDPQDLPSLPSLDDLPKAMPEDLLNRIAAWRKYQRAKELPSRLEEFDIKWEIDDTLSSAPKTFTSTSTTTTTIEETQEVELTAFAAPGTVTISYATLSVPHKRRPLMPYLDSTQLESYLSDTQFKRVMRVDRKTFARLPKWKQNGKKKEVGLF